MLKSLRLAAMAMLAFAAATQPAEQMPASVYARAEALLGPNLVSRVRNGFTTPHWFGTADEFWYRRELPNGYDFVRVSAATGRKRAAFDHAAVARALSATRSESVDGMHLPFERFDYMKGGAGIIFTVNDQSYECTLAKGVCRAQKLQRPPADVLVSPDGRWGVRTRDGNLWLRDMASGAEHAITDDGVPDSGYGIYPDNRADYAPTHRERRALPPFDARWAPDSSRLLVAFIDQRNVQPYPFVESAPLDGSFRPRLYPARIPLVGEKPARAEWVVFDIPAGTHRRLQLPYEKLLVIQQDILAVREWWWSRAARHVFCAAHGDNMESAFLFDVDLTTGTARTVIEERLPPRTDLNSTSYNPVNVHVTADGTEAIWFSQRDGWGHLYRYDVRTGALKNRITQGDWLVRDIIQVDEAQRRVYFTGGGREGGNPYYRYLYRVSFDGTGLTQLSPETADHLLLPNKPAVLSSDGITPHAVVSPSGRYVAYNYSRLDQPTRFVVRSLANPSVTTTIETADASGLVAAGWRAPEEFVVKAADGKSELWGTLYKPTDFDPRKKYPIIDSQYASPLTAFTQRHFFQAWRGKQPLAPSSYAELGFLVMSVDARGTTYRSREFSQAGYGKLNLIGLDDHVAALRQLAERHAYVDLDRVGIIGHSYGGFTAYRAMLEYPDFFKVGIASAGAADTHAMYLDYHWTAFQGRPVYSDASELRPSATEVPANYQSLNGSAQASRLKGKLLIQLGELDENVPPGQILQFVAALISANKDFELLYLPSRDHQFIGEGYVMRRDWDFMVRNLLGQEPPAGYEIKVSGR